MPNYFYKKIVITYTYSVCHKLTHKYKN